MTSEIILALLTLANSVVVIWAHKRISIQNNSQQK